MWNKRIQRIAALALSLAVLLALPAMAAGNRPSLSLRIGGDQHEAYLHG